MRGLTIAAVVGVLLSAGCDLPERQRRGQGSAAQRSDGGARYVGHQSAQKFLHRVLVAPTTAEYPWDEVRAQRLESGPEYEAWLVRGAVDSQNRFGAKIRGTWSVVVLKQDDELFPIWVQLDDERIWGTARALAEAGIRLAGDPAPEKAETPEAEPEPEPRRPARAERPPVREWTDTSGEFRVRAVFRGAAFGKVRLEREDGQTIEVPIDRLSDDDQAWIRSRR